MTPEKQTISVRGGMFETELRVAGSGEPLVFLHGGGGFPGWAPFLDDLAEDFTVYVARHPGWGDSTGWDVLSDAVDMAVYYFDLFDALGLRSANILGSSLGGMFAAEIAALGPSYVGRLILQAPAGLAPEGAPPPDSFSMDEASLLQATYHDPDAILARIPAQDDSAEARERALAEREKLARLANKFLHPTWDHGLARRLHRIVAPTLLIWGESDGLVPLPHAYEFNRLIPESRLAIMPRTGHVPSMESRDTYVALIRDFLNADDLHPLPLDKNTALIQQGRS